MPLGPRAPGLAHLERRGQPHVQGGDVSPSVSHTPAQRSQDKGRDSRLQAAIEVTLCIVLTCVAFSSNAEAGQIRASSLCSSAPLCQVAGPPSIQALCLQQPQAASAGTLHNVPNVANLTVAGPSGTQPPGRKLPQAACGNEPRGGVSDEV